MAAGPDDSPEDKHITTEQLIADAENYVEHGQKLDTLIMNGNAGGAIATLGFIGTIVGASAGKGPIPVLTFLVLLMFLIGLAAAIWIRHRVAMHFKNTLLMRADIEAGPARRPGNLSVYLRRISMASLGVGTGLGLYQLWQLTGSIAVVSSAAS